MYACKYTWMYIMNVCYKNVINVIDPCCFSIKVATALNDRIWYSHKPSPHAILLQMDYDKHYWLGIVRVWSVAYFVINTNIPIILCNKSANLQIYTIHMVLLFQRGYICTYTNTYLIGFYGTQEVCTKFHWES